MLGPSRAKTIVKTSSILVLCLASYLLSGPIWLTVALGFCALGDYFLAQGSERSFMMGIAAFALGHLGCGVAFLTHSNANWAGASGMFVPILIAMAIAMMAYLYPRAENLKAPIMIYIPIIVSMAIAATALPRIGPLALVIPGALLFLFSDFIISLEKFALTKVSSLRKFTPFLVWSTYWVAQLLLLLGLAP